jgi:ATP-dependent DNA ligase
MAATYIETVNAKKSGVEGELGKKNMKFRGFFLMPLSEWTAEVSTITMRQSREHITQLCDKLGLVKITVSKGKEVHSHEEMMEYLEEVTQPGYDGLPKGQEGLILKNWNGLYQWDRVMDWCKVKKFFDVDVRIVGFVEGRKGTKLEGTLGRINYVGFLEDGTRVEGGVGSGLKEKKPKDDPNCPTRDEIWNNQEKFLGTTMVVKYQEVSKGKDKKYPSLRFPTVFRFRDDKIVEID